jgi:hypothetical protein
MQFGFWLVYSLGMHASQFRAEAARSGTDAAGDRCGFWWALYFALIVASRPSLHDEFIPDILVVQHQVFPLSTDHCTRWSGWRSCSIMTPDEPYLREIKSDSY